MSFPQCRTVDIVFAGRHENCAKIFVRAWIPVTCRNTLKEKIRGVLEVQSLRVRLLPVLCLSCSCLTFRDLVFRFTPLRHSSAFGVLGSWRLGIRIRTI